MERPRKRARNKSPVPQPDQAQLLPGQPSSTPAARPSPAAPSRARRPRFDFNGRGRPPGRNTVQAAALADLQGQGIRPFLAPAPPPAPASTSGLDVAVRETPSPSSTPPGATAGIQPALVNRPVPSVHIDAPATPAAAVAPPPGAASAAGQGSGQGEPPTPAPTFTAVDAYDMSGSGMAAQAQSEFDPKFLVDRLPGLEAWSKTADEAPTTPVQALPPQGVYHNTRYDYKYLGIETGIHHGKCTDARHHDACMAIMEACTAIIDVDTRMAPRTSLVSKAFLHERKSLRAVPGLEQYGGIDWITFKVGREARPPCLVTAIVAPDLPPGINMVLCTKDAARLGYDIPADQYNECTAVPPENQGTLDGGSGFDHLMGSMPVDTEGLPRATYPHPAPPSIGLEPWNGSGVMSAASSLSGPGPTVPSDNFSPVYLPLPPPSPTSGSGNSFTATATAAAGPYTGYDCTFVGKEFLHGDAWDFINDGNNGNPNHEHPRAS